MATVARVADEGHVSKGSTELMRCCGAEAEEEEVEEVIEATEIPFCPAALVRAPAAFW